MHLLLLEIVFIKATTISRRLVRRKKAAPTFIPFIHLGNSLRTYDDDETILATFIQDFVVQIYHSD